MSQAPPGAGAAVGSCPPVVLPGAAGAPRGEAEQSVLLCPGVPRGHVRAAARGVPSPQLALRVPRAPVEPSRSRLPSSAGFFVTVRSSEWMCHCALSRVTVAPCTTVSDFRGTL